MGLSYMAFIMLRYVPSMSAFWRVYHKWMLNFVKAFSASIEIIIWFLSFNLLMWCIILIDLWILKNPWFPGIKPTWSWCMIFLICCWILFARILFRIFASRFISEIQLPMPIPDLLNQTLYVWILGSSVFKEPSEMSSKMWKSPKQSPHSASKETILTFSLFIMVNKRV